MRARVIDAFVADFQCEWLDATTPWQRVFVAVRGYGSFAATMAGCLVHDAQHDFVRCAARVLKFVVPATVSLGSVFWPSWRETGQIDWIDVARRFAWIGAFTAALFISAHRSQHATRRAWAPFFLAVCGVAMALVFAAITRRHKATYEWIYMMSLTLAWPFLVTKKRNLVVKSSD